MEIYLLRHGIAEEATGNMADEERALTSEGRRKLRELLRLARTAGVKPEVILSSPLRRAGETAEIAREVLGGAPEMLKTTALLPHATPFALWEEIRVHSFADSILLAGHQPQLAMAVAYLLNAPELEIDMKKGCLVRVDLSQFGAEPRGLLRFMLSPKFVA